MTAEADRFAELVAALKRALPNNPEAQDFWTRAGVFAEAMQATARELFDGRLGIIMVLREDGTHHGAVVYHTSAEDAARALFEGHRIVLQQLAVERAQERNFPRSEDPWASTKRKHGRRVPLWAAGDPDDPE